MITAPLPYVAHRCRYHDAVVLVLYETDSTWAGSLHERKDTCCVAAMAINSQRKKQPILWSSKRLPSDAFSLTAVPYGGAIIVTPSLIIYQNKARPLAHSTADTVTPW